MWASRQAYPPLAGAMRRVLAGSMLAGGAAPIEHGERMRYPITCCVSIGAMCGNSGNSGNKCPQA